MSNEVSPDRPVALEFRIDVEGANGSVSLTFNNGEYPAYDPIKHPWLGPQYLETCLVSIRKLLSNWAEKYNALLADRDGDRLGCAGNEIERMWIDLATWGWNLYKDIFDLQA